MNSETTETLDEVRLAILRQHTQLGQLLDELEGAAKEVLANAADAPAALHTALSRFHPRFMKHLEYEDTHILEPGILGDHADQRSRIEGLIHDRSVFADPCSLAHEATAFVHYIRKDLKEEEGRLRALHRA